MSAALIHLTTLALLSVCFACLAGCKREPGGAPAPTATSQPAPLPAEQITEMENRGVGLMGRYDFDGAIRVFSELATHEPSMAAEKVNLAIAHLNRQQEGDVAQAMTFLDQALAQSPDNLRALYCKGLLQLNGGHPAEALANFRRVAAADPKDPYAIYYTGQCLLSTGDAPAALKAFLDAVRLDPALRSAHYGAFQCFQQLKKPDDAHAQLTEFQKLKDDPQAKLVEFKYTRMGSKGEAAVSQNSAAAPEQRPAGPVFADGAPLPITNGAALAWRKAAADDPLPIRVTAADIDGDGKLDLFITNALTVDGSVRNAVLLAREGGFEMELNHPLAGVQSVNAALWGDVDNDGLTDVYFCRHGANQLWRQMGPGQWKDITEASMASGGDQFNTIDGALVDADHDGDLDIFLIRSDGPNELLNNNGDGTFRPIAREAQIAGDGSGAVGLAVTDLNHDGAADLVVLKRQPPHEVYINDRLWRYHKAAGFDAFNASPASAVVAADVAAHGQVSLITSSAGGLAIWSPGEEGNWKATPLMTAPTAVPAGPLAAMDVDGSGIPSLLFGSSDGWAATPLVPNAPSLYSAKSPARNFLLAQLGGGQGPSVLAPSPGGPPVVWNPGPGRFPFLDLRLTGKLNNADSMRSNASGIGVQVSVRTGQRWSVLDTYRQQSGPGQSAQPIAIGLGGATRADFVRLIWPDGLQQTELSLATGAMQTISETQRQTSSCPIIFVWDGRHYEFVTDCLGVGGLGFAIGRGEYAPVRPFENVLLPDSLMKPLDGRYQIKIGEPMEEACYLDAAQLVRYDLPPGWRMTLDERMGVNDPQPTGKPMFFRQEMVAASATNDRGEDITAIVAQVDGKAAEPGRRDPRFTGFTAEHFVDLKFDRPIGAGPGAPMLIADGWIEYPYSQTMFAAWQAQAPFSAPTLEARGGDGKWIVVLDQFGYPAGMPRQMAVPIPAEKLPPGCSELRIRTTQEIYWDRLAIAWAEPCPQAARIVQPLASARLADVGFPRRTTGPQNHPHYDYDHRVPLWDTRRQDGFYTRWGPVEDLLKNVDDAVAVFGPGEEIHAEFTASGNALPAGWTSRFVLELAGWCKDRDLYTRDGETLAPLPTRTGNPGQSTRERDALHERYNTRYEAGG